MQKDFGEKLSQKLVKSEAKTKQKSVESGAKISCLGAFLELSATEMTQFWSVANNVPQSSNSR